MSIALVGFDRERKREELRKMSDKELVATGRMLRELLRHSQSVTRPAGTREPPWAIQLEDAIAEWRARRQHPMRCLCHAERGARR